MRKILLIAVAVALVASASHALSVIGSKHDLSSAGPGAKSNTSEVCVFCHTPHQPDTPTLITIKPLWNHTLSATTTYGVYGSSTMNATPVDIGTTNTVALANFSNLCMSCHDGTISVASLYNPRNSVTTTVSIVTAGGNVALTGLIAGTPNLGTNLTNDHPINFTYNTALATADGGLNDPAVTAAVTKLIPGGTVQCSSCHNPHDNQFGSFLVKTNAASALCTTCHTK